MGCRHYFVVDLVEDLVGEVVHDLLNELTNTTVLSLLHNRMWQSRNSEVDVNLV